MLEIVHAVSDLQTFKPQVAQHKPQSSKEQSYLQYWKLFIIAVTQ